METADEVIPFMIRFNFDKEKFIALMQYFSKNSSDLDVLKAVKLLYLADRECLLKYGRPILGDRYIAMDLGPVPSRAYDIIKGIEEKTLSESLIFTDESTRYPVFKTNDEPNMDIFSEAEIEIMNEILEKYGSLSGIELSHITHKHKAWTESTRNDTIDYRLFFADDPELHSDSLEAMILEQEDRDFTDNL